MVLTGRNETKEERETEEKDDIEEVRSASRYCENTGHDAEGLKTSTLCQPKTSRYVRACMAQPYNQEDRNGPYKRSGLYSRANRCDASVLTIAQKSSDSCVDVAQWVVQIPQ